MQARRSPFRGIIGGPASRSADPTATTTRAEQVPFDEGTTIPTPVPPHPDRDRGRAPRGGRQPAEAAGSPPPLFRRLPHVQSRRPARLESGLSRPGRRGETDVRRPLG